jgi:hypothetical protein
MKKDICMLITRERYLHFDNLDLSLPLISSNCSLCRREFNEAPVSGEHIDLVLTRIRARFDAHECTPREGFRKWNA